MTAFRRPRHNFALDRAVAWAHKLRRPLLILEVVRLDYPWASRRHHRFLVEGMADNQAACAGIPGLLYHPYVEPAPRARRGLLAAFAAEAAVVVIDDYPIFVPGATAAAAGRLTPVLVEAVDSNGLLPLGDSPGEFATAHSFRRFLQKRLIAEWPAFPIAAPFQVPLPTAAPPLPAPLRQRWPATDLRRALADPAWLAGLPIDGAVAPVAASPGGYVAAAARLRGFCEGKLGRYVEERAAPASDGGSGLSPYLHFGHLGAHEIFLAVAAIEGWWPERLPPRASGSKAGWWGMRPGAEAFLDEAITWREVGFHGCRHRPDFDRYESLPAWAQRTLDAHAGDPRQFVYSLAELEEGRTHDRLWNAAQRELRESGRIHSYLRMLWGKKILEWTRDPRQALAFLIQLNNRWALDGRDPNSYSGVGWCLGRFDRPWAPTRPIFGSVRYMSSANAARKLDLKPYLARWGEGGGSP